MLFLYAEGPAFEITLYLFCEFVGGGMCMWRGVPATCHQEGQRTMYRTQFSLFSLWVQLSHLTGPRH